MNRHSDRIENILTDIRETGIDFMMATVTLYNGKGLTEDERNNLLRVATTYHDLATAIEDMAFEEVEK